MNYKQNKNSSTLVFRFFTYNSSALVGPAFGAFWEDLEEGFIKFAVKRASKQDQIVHMEGTLHVILYFRVVCYVLVKCPPPNLRQKLLRPCMS